MSHVKHNLKRNILTPESKSPKTAKININDNNFYQSTGIYVYEVKHFNLSNHARTVIL